MADTDKIEVTFTRQKVYHDGTSMIVAKADETREIERFQVAGFLAEGSIAEPEGWADQVAMASLPRADGGPVFAPAPSNAAHLAQHDHDGDGEPGGSKPRAKGKKAKASGTPDPELAAARKRYRAAFGKGGSPKWTAAELDVKTAAKVGSAGGSGEEAPPAS